LYGAIDPHPVAREGKVRSRHHFETQYIHVEVFCEFQILGSDEKVIKRVNWHKKNPLKWMHSVKLCG
jgi:hypothetical protein